MTPQRPVAPARALISGASLAALLLLAAGPGHAQNREPALEGQFSVEDFSPAPGPRNLIVTRGARIGTPIDWSAALVVNYAYRPFVVQTCDGPSDCPEDSDNDVAVVKSLVTGDFMGTIVPIERLQLALTIPVTYSEGQGLTPNGLPAKGGLSAVGMGDPELEVKGQLWGDAKTPYVIGALVYAALPAGMWTADDTYIGNSTVTAGGAVIFDGDSGPFSFGANVGGVYRGAGRVGNTTIGSELTYSFGGGFRASPLVRVLVDFYGSSRFNAQKGSNGLEVDVAAEVTPLSSPLSFLAGAGTGAIQGVGIPAVRGFVGARFTMESRDRDEDQLADNADQCPTVAEDRDGTEDADGCPEPDNDLDMILDVNDQCPNEAEDVDEFEDLDGCPEPDNDKDLLPDVRDQCPNAAETMNGLRDEDGCPDESDRDQDGIPDSTDKCPDEAEDTDGYQDLDGCLDVDNDGDEIPDTLDECVDEPENKNGREDADGCPD